MPCLDSSAWTSLRNLSAPVPLNCSTTTFFGFSAWAIPAPTESKNADARKQPIAPFISLLYFLSVLGRRGQWGPKNLTFLERGVSECQRSPCGCMRPKHLHGPGVMVIDFVDRDAKNGLPSWETQTCYDSELLALRVRTF